MKVQDFFNTKMDISKYTFEELEHFTDCFGKGLSEFNELSLKIFEDPRIHFKEAPIRILRTIRFAAILGWEIDSTTWKAMQESSTRQLLANIPRKELGDEFILIVGAAFPDYGMKLLLDSGIMLQWMQAAIKGSVYEGHMSPWSMDQNSVYHELTLEQHTLQVLRNSLLLHCDAPMEKKLILRLTAICHDLGKMYQPIQGRNECGYTSYHGGVSPQPESAAREGSQDRTRNENTVYPSRKTLFEWIPVDGSIQSPRFGALDIRNFKMAPRAAVEYGDFSRRGYYYSEETVSSVYQVMFNII
jgi:hypothetical protein